jgi:hypothetical protein
MTRRTLFSAICIGLFTSLALKASACTVPVFRYALDRWPSEPWQLEAPLSTFTTEPLAGALRNLGGTSPLNLSATASPENSTAARLLFPTQTSKEPVPAWQGTLDEAAWKRLGDSPARQEFTRRVLDGESAVWVVVSGTDATANADFLTRLKKRLTFLETAAQLPFIDPNDPDSQLGPGPEVKLKFSILEINRQDPLEEVTVAMLAGTKGTKSFPTEQPFAALAFGRGRVLGAWPATDLQDAQIEESTLFLTKACSCQAKALNPGWDLLMTVNWDDALRAVEDKRPKSTAASSKPTPPEVVQIVPTKSAPVDAIPSKRNHSKLLASIAVGLLFVVLGTKLFGRQG